MKIAYFDCFAGAGGDMIVAAMLDAGLDAEFLKKQIDTLGIDQLELKISKTNRGGIEAVRFEPIAPHQHKHRNLAEITGIIEKSGISEKAKQTAIEIFNLLAAAEGKIHGKDPNEIHFHEVGAIDSIADIVSAAVGLDALEIDKVYCSRLSVGGGTVKCAHSVLPVPAPATAEILKNVPITLGPGNFEMLTPSAAAILVTIVDEFCALPAMQVESIGYGAGSRVSEEFANVLRLILGQSADSDNETCDSVLLLETNIDDTSGELIGHVTEVLLAAGALDVYTTAITMKHNRPAVQISVICNTADCEKMERILFEQAGTFGIRKQTLQRSKLERKFIKVETEFGKIGIKIGYLGKNKVNAKAEFGDLKAAAERYHVAIKRVMEAAMRAYEKMND